MQNSFFKKDNTLKFINYLGFLDIFLDTKIPRCLIRGFCFIKDFQLLLEPEANTSSSHQAFIPGIGHTSIQQHVVIEVVEDTNSPAEFTIIVTGTS